MTSHKNTLAPLVALIVLSISLGQSGIAQSDDSTHRSNKGSDITFGSNIVPILKRYCLPCHTEDNMNPSELYLDSYENLLKGGKHGRSLVPGNADESLLIRKIGPNPPFGRPMPLKAANPFPDDTLQLLRKWIEAGARND